VVGASLRALDLIERSDELRDRLWANTRSFRARMAELEFDVLPGDHPIVPVMIGDAPAAARFSQSLVAHGVFAVAFSYPVVPLGTARIRTQMSAAHTDDDIALAVRAFVAARDETSG
jgi:glycine C-acetyltransferase